jgi:hypothetical protein
MSATARLFAWQVLARFAVRSVQHHGQRRQRNDHDQRHRSQHKLHPPATSWRLLHHKGAYVVYRFCRMFIDCFRAASLADSADLHGDQARNGDS